MKRLVLILALLAGSSLAHASGTCTAGAIAQAAAGSTPVTISGCWYAATGSTACAGSPCSDSNNGTTEATAFAHAPGMQNCASNCASAVVAAGNGVILRGGDTWTSGSFMWSLPSNGTSGSPTYIGVDKTWHAGASYARPILNAGGSAITNNFGRLISVSGNTTFDNLEITGYYWSTSSCSDPFGQCTMLFMGQTNNETVENIYVHGWTHQGTDHTATAGVANVFSFGGGNSTLSVHDSVFTGTDVSGDHSVNVFFDGPGVMYNNYIQQVSSAMIVSYPNLVHDNFIDDIGPSFCNEPFPTYAGNCSHENGFEDNGDIGLTFYNNVITNVAAGLALWIAPNPSFTANIFNNVIYNIQDNQVLDVPALPVYNATYCSSGPNGQGYCNYGGNIVLENNTVQCGDDSTQYDSGCSTSVGPSGSSGTNTYVSKNNHFIVLDLTGTGCGATPNCTFTSNTVQTQSTANGQGYNSSQTYAFYPTSGGSTIGAGSNLTGSWPIGSTNDTNYGCTDVSNVSTCPARTSNLRPASGAWDSGAYEFSSGGQASAATCTPTSGNAPQSLTCLNTNSAPTVMCEAISPVTPVTNGLGTGCTTGNSLGTGSSESFSVLIGATYEFVAGTSTLADSNPTSYTFSNCPAQYQAGTPGLPNYGGIRIDQCVANIGAIPNLWTNYSADHGFSGAGTSATNDFGNKICRITDGNSDPSQIGGTFTTNYSGSDVDQHIAVDGSMFTIGRDGASYSLLYIYNGIGCPQQVQTSPGVPYEIPTKITAFSQSASTPRLLHVMNITQGGPSPVTSVNSSGTYTGTIAAGSSNNLVGDYGIVSGFGAGGNIASPTLISASTNTSVTFSGVTTTPQSCPGTCTLTVVSQAQIQNYDLSSCTVTACSPTITTVYDFAQGTELNWANGFQPSWSSVWRWSLDDTTSSIAFSNNQGAAGGQNTGTLVATYKVGSGARVMNTFPASIALTAVNGSGVYSCSCAGAVNNLYVGATMSVTGFSNSDNNVTDALITASSATSLTISATTTSETNSATAAFSVAGIPGETIVGDYGPTGSIAMTNCGGTPGSCSAPDGYNIHDMYQFGNSTANYVVGEKCLSGTGCTPGSTTLDQPYAWLIDSQNVLATNSSGHFGVGYNYIMHGTNSPQGQAGLFEVQSGGSLVSSPSSINLVSTSGPDNLPNPGAILLDIHCSWNENLGNDYYPVECGNTTVAINQAESPAHFANNGCDQHGYLQSPPNCLTTNLFTGPLVNELIIYPTAPIGGPTCTSAPCSTLPLLRLGNGYISAVSNDFSAANLIESIAPTGGYVLYSADHMGTLGSTSISVTSFTGTSGTLTFQAVNAFTAGNTITFGGFAGSNTGLNGQTVTVLSAGLSGSQFEATVSGAGYSSGRGQIVDPPPYILGGLTWQGGATAGSHAYNGGDVITPLDSNAPNCTYHALAAGNSSGSTEPTWVSGGLCITSNITDNTVTWVYDGMQNMRGDVFMVKTGIANVVIPPNNFLLLGSIYANGLFDGGY